MLPDLDFILKEITKIKTVITEIGVGEEGDTQPGQGPSLAPARFHLTRGHSPGGEADAEAHPGLPCPGP